MTPLRLPGIKATSHVCSRHGREHSKTLDEKPVKPARSIQPKPVRQTSFQAKSGNRAETLVSD